MTLADLDELEAKARAAQSVCWYEPTVDFWPSPHQPSDEDAAFISACDPDTILNLIERVRAGEELCRATAEVQQAYHQLVNGGDQWVLLGPLDMLRRASERWESLAHSPQEAG